ncbi:MAG: hypothetical protein M5U35_13850 [Roseovarius sp.]|nr:hypothetical protein [Roseovarius sp.]
MAIDFSQIARAVDTHISGAMSGLERVYIDVAVGTVSPGTTSALQP